MFEIFYFCFCKPTFFPAEGFGFGQEADINADMTIGMLQGICDVVGMAGAGSRLGLVVLKIEAVRGNL